MLNVHFKQIQGTALHLSLEYEQLPSKMVASDIRNLHYGNRHCILTTPGAYVLAKY